MARSFLLKEFQESDIENVEKFATDNPREIAGQLFYGLV